MRLQKSQSPVVWRDMGLSTCSADHGREPRPTGNSGVGDARAGKFSRQSLRGRGTCILCGKLDSFHPGTSEQLKELAHADLAKKQFFA